MCWQFLTFERMSSTIGKSGRGWRWNWSKRALVVRSKTEPKSYGSYIQKNLFLKINRRGILTPWYFFSAAGSKQQPSHRQFRVFRKGGWWNGSWNNWKAHNWTAARDRAADWKTIWLPSGGSNFCEDECCCRSWKISAFFYSPKST